MPVPSWRLAAAAAVIAGLVLLSPAPGLALVAANGALLLVAVVDWGLAPSARRLQVTRSVPGSRRFSTLPPANAIASTKNRSR